jgi:hypothetical protein
MLLVATDARRTCSTTAVYCDPRLLGFRAFAIYAISSSSSSESDTMGLPLGGALNVLSESPAVSAEESSPEMPRMDRPGPRTGDSIGKEYSIGRILSPEASFEGGAELSEVVRFIDACNTERCSGKLLIVAAVRFVSASDDERGMGEYEGIPVTLVGLLEPAELDSYSAAASSSKMSCEIGCPDEAVGETGATGLNNE